MVERELIISQGGPLTFYGVQAHFQGGGIANKDTGLSESDDLSLDALVADHIRHVLEMTGGKVDGRNGAAELLDIKSGTLRHRMRKLGIPFGRMKR